MKKLGKLKLNPERILINQELISLRGGTGDTLCLHCGANGNYLGIIETQCGLNWTQGLAKCQEKWENADDVWGTCSSDNCSY
jgi:natural product precursor